MISCHEISRSSLSLPPPSYIYSVRPAGADHLATICSDDSLQILDASSLALVRARATAHEGVTCLVGTPDASVPYLTSGRDGCIRGWDVRTGSNSFQIENGKPLPIAVCWRIMSGVVRMEKTMNCWTYERSWADERLCMSAVA